MSQRTIATGAAANDGTGDAIRAAFTKINADIADLYALLAGGGGGGGGGSGTVTSVNVTQPAAGITTSGGPITSSGSILLTLANDLAALEALTGTNIIPYRSGVDAWGPITIGSGLSFSGGTLSATGGGGGGSGTVTSVNITQPAAGITASGGPVTASGSITLALANDLAALEGLASTGLAARTAADTWAQRTITGTANEVDVANGNGVAGNPTLSLPTTLTLTGKTVTVANQTASDNSTKAANTAYVDAAVATLAAVVSGALVFKGSWDASVGTFPGGGTAQTGAFYKVSVAGTVGGVAFSAGDDIYAVTNNASTSTYANNWLKVEGSITSAEVAAALGYTPLAPPSGTALLKANAGGALANATSGTDYAPATSGSAILKGNGAGGFSSATAGTDYLAPPSGTALLKANSGGALANATGGTDYADLAFKTISVAGQSDVVADSAADTLTLVAGTNVTITTNASTDTITIAASGGGGGSDTRIPSTTTAGQVPYFSSTDGTEAAMAGLSWDNTNRALTWTGATVTTSMPLLNMTQTWNGSGVTFNGLLLNVTDTLSAAASNLLNLQKGGTTQFRVDKTGVIYSVQAGNATVAIYGGFAGYGLGFGGNGQGVFFMNTQKAVDLGTRGVTVRSTDGYAWTSSTDATATADTFITRPAAAEVQHGAADAAAPVAQSIRFQSVVAGTTNTAGANATIKGSRGTGTGAGGDIIFQTAAAGSSGTAQNALTEVFRVRNDGVVGFGTHSAVGAEVITGYITIKDTAGNTRKLAVIS